MAKTVIEVKKNPNENNSSVLRRFSRRIQESALSARSKALVTMSVLNQN